MTGSNSFLRMEQAFGMGMLLRQLATLDARVAVIHGVVDVAENLDRPTTLDRDLDAAKGMAEPANCSVNLGHLDVPLKTLVDRTLLC